MNKKFNVKYFFKVATSGAHVVNNSETQIIKEHSTKVISHTPHPTLVSNNSDHLHKEKKLFH